MSHPLSFLIDNALRAAEADGAFDNLPGAGKPLPKVSHPKDAVVNRILRDAKAVPPAVLFQKQITASQSRLKTLTDPAARKAEMRRLADLQTRLAIEQEAWRKYG